MSRKIFSTISLMTLIFSGAVSGSVYAEEKSSGSGISGETTVMETIEVVAERDKKPAERYQKKMDRRKIETSGQGNGDIGSLLRGMSNVQYADTFNNSSTPGEIDPARISISGGQFYQNLITIDGVNISNRMDPANTNTNSWWSLPGATQTVNIDVDLLDSITVLDSAISAKYGGFSGGVVETELRRPTKPLGMKLSYKFTNGNIERGWPHSLTEYHLNDNSNYYSREEWLDSYQKNLQPEFRKYVTQLTAESQINEKFALLGSLNIQQSTIPLRRHIRSYLSNDPDASYPSPINATINPDEKTDTKRRNVNAILKAYLDPSDDLKLEFGYTYAPNFSRETFVGNRPGVYYDFEHGGNIVNFRTKWNNAWGKFTNTLNYQDSGDRTTPVGYTHGRDWWNSDSKNWTNWASRARESGPVGSERNNKTLTESFEQEFKPFNLGITEHRILTGGEFSYTKADFQFTGDQFSTQQRSARAMTLLQQQACRGTDMYWCDPAPAYDSANWYPVNGDTIINYSWVDADGNNHQTRYWPYGQYFSEVYYYSGGSPISVSDKQYALFLEDEIKIPLGAQKQAGEVTLRPGVRYDYNSYMKDHNTAPRLFTDYAFPWSGPDKGFSTHISGGYNRYYGNNLYVHRLNDGIESKRGHIRRDDPSRSFEDILAENRPCEDSQDSNCIEMPASLNDSKFDRLKTPYADEYMVGLSQDLGLFNLTAKYVRRNGRDEVVRTYGRSDARALDGYTNNYYYYTNEGHSTTDIVTVDLKNRRPLTFWGITNNFTLAFDWTDTTRSKATYMDNYQEYEMDFPWVWNRITGSLMPYGELPPDNYSKPWSLKLETTHEWEMLGGLWTVNNLFTFKQKYKRPLLVDYLRGSNASERAEMAALLGITEEEAADIERLNIYDLVDLPSTFTWDLKFGVEYEVYKKNKIFFNIDIYNLTNKKNVTTAGSYRGEPYRFYGTGRQFWIEFGYKF